MFVVAITRLATPVEVEAALLGSELGLALYEARLKLQGAMPAVVLATPDRARAQAQLAALRQRGHGAVACDDAAVHRRKDMTVLRRFRFETGAVVVADPLGVETRLQESEVLALLRAVHLRNTETTTDATVKKFAPGRALLTGGLVMSKKTTREVVGAETTREDVLYLFRHTGATPWILVDHEAKYGVLGPDLALTQRENFLATVGRLRAVFPQARYDERLLAVRKTQEQFTQALGSKSSETSSSDGFDLLAHLLAIAIVRGQAD